MNNNLTKVEKIAIIVTVVAVFMVFGGIGYAFFTMNDNTGSTAEITNTSGKMTITYADGGSNLLVSNNITPSDNIIADKTFTLTGLNTTTAGDGLTMPYKVGLKYSSTFSDGQIHYYIKKISSTNEGITTNYNGTINTTIPGHNTETGYTTGTLKKGNRYIEFVNGEFPASIDSQTITFNLKLQFPDNGENQDTEKGKTLNAEIIINNDVTPTTFAADSWETIAAVYQTGNFDAYKVGDEKEVEIDGKSYTVRVANTSTPDECNKEDFSETACGIVIEFVDIVENRPMNNSTGTPLTNKGGWPASELRTYANGEFFNKLPKELQDIIIDTKVISSHGSEDTSNFISNDKIYLLSGHEVWKDSKAPSQIAITENSNNYKLLSNEISNDYISIGEIIAAVTLYKDDSSYYNTRQLDYYEQKGVTTTNYTDAIKNSKTWLLRSSYLGNSSNFIKVSEEGFASTELNTFNGFAPAFRIG